MITVLLSIALVSQRPGNICELRSNQVLVAPGSLNWALRDPSFRVAAGTRALILRINPDRTDGVAEIKLYDGTDRLAWVESAGLKVLSGVVAGNITNASPSAGLSAQSGGAANTYGANSYRPRRVKRLPDFTEVNAAIDGMAQVTMANQYRPPTLPGWISPTLGSGSPTFGGAGGYYVGPRQPPGHYVGGVGSSHAGGKYVNPYTDNRYQKRTLP